MAIKARFYINAVTRRANQHTEVEMRPVVRAHTTEPGGGSGGEADRINKPWSKYTPSGLFTMNVSPESGAGEFFMLHLGEDVDITIEAARPENATPPLPQVIPAAEYDAN